MTTSIFKCIDLTTGAMMSIFWALGLPTIKNSLYFHQNSELTHIRGTTGMYSFNYKLTYNTWFRSVYCFILKVIL